MLEKKTWQLNLAYRYYESYKHFVGDSEQDHRVEDGTEVINISHATDIGFSYGLTNRIVLSVNLPLQYYKRTSLYEHYGNSTSANPQQMRFATNAEGIGDIRISSFYSFINPGNDSSRWNLAGGIAVKVPTGNENVIDEFHRLNAAKQDSLITRPVDQSIQLGDGGWGFNLELHAGYKLSPQWSLYFNGFYLFNPQRMNNTLTRGTLTNVDPLIAYHSIADQYAARIGASTWLSHSHSIKASLGGRIEGVPAKDLIGQDDGFRRPGYIVSIEPGISTTFSHFGISVYVPVSVYRNRIKSFYDLSDPTGVRHGDAAFADYLVNVSLSYSPFSK